MVVIKHEKKLCLSYTQFALILAIIAFIINALLTFGAILGLRHTTDAWELVLADLAEEENQNAISVYFSERQQYKSNKRLLHESQHVVQVLIFLLDIGTILGCINQIACGLMVYGIAVRAPKCLLPWLFISGLTYMLIGTTIFMAYLEAVPGVYITLHDMIASLVLSTVFIIVWCTMLHIYSMLARLSCGKKIGSLTPTIIQAYGGYLHTIEATPLEKKVVV